MQIEMYTSDKCYACEQTKSLLAKHGTIKEKNISDDNWRQELAAIGFKTVPVTVFKGLAEDGKDLIIRGYNPVKFRKLIDEAKSKI